MSRKARQQQRRLEALEPRAMMTGNVTVTVVEGELRIVGDPLDNGITISQTGTGNYLVTPDATTTINGLALNTAVPVTGVTADFEIKLVRGDDSVTLQALTVPEDLEISAGDGNDTIVLRNVLITQNAEIKAGKGADVITLQPITPAPATPTPTSGVVAGKLLAIDAGADRDTLTLDTVTAETYVHRTGKRDTVVKVAGTLDFDRTKAVSHKLSDKAADVIFQQWVRKYG